MKKMALIGFSIENVDPCSICLEDMNAIADVCMADCGHCFHKNCTGSERELNFDKCPICRRDIDNTFSLSEEEVHSLNYSSSSSGTMSKLYL